MKVEKFEHAVNNLINGNLSDFKREVKKLKKYEIIDLLLFVEEQYSETIYFKEFLKRLRHFLSD